MQPACHPCTAPVKCPKHAGRLHGNFHIGVARVGRHRPGLHRSHPVEELLLRLHLRHQVQPRVAQASPWWCLRRHRRPARRQGHLVQESPPPTPPLHPCPQLLHPEDRVDKGSRGVPEGELPDDHQHDAELPLHAARHHPPAARAEARARTAQLWCVPRRAAGPTPVKKTPQVCGHGGGGEGAARHPGALAGDRRQAREGGREDRAPCQVCAAGLRRAAVVAG